jgi:hypothetical protein
MTVCICWDDPAVVDMFCPEHSDELGIVSPGQRIPVTQQFLKDHQSIPVQAFIDLLRAECTCPSHGLSAYCRLHGLCDPAVDL